MPHVIWALYSFSTARRKLDLPADVRLAESPAENRNLMDRKEFIDRLAIFATAVVTVSV